MNRNPSQGQATELSSALSALPSRKMFPAPLTPVKDALANTLSAATTGGTLAAATIAGAIAEQVAQDSVAPAQLVAAPPGLSKELEKALEDIEAAAAGSSSGSSVLDAPVKEEEQQQQQPKEQKKVRSGPINQKEGLKRQQQQERDEAQRRISKRDQELKDRKAYLKNFWYAAGKLVVSVVGRCRGTAFDSQLGPPPQ
jgi:hypothetical protein